MGACGTFDVGAGAPILGEPDSGRPLDGTDAPAPQTDAALEESEEPADAATDTSTTPDAAPPVEPCKRADLQDASFLQYGVAHGWVVSPTFQPAPLGIVAEPKDPLPVARCQVSDDAVKLSDGFRIELDITVNKTPNSDTFILRMSHTTGVGVASLKLSSSNRVTLELPGKSVYCGYLAAIPKKLFLSLQQDDQIRQCCKVTDATDDDSSNDCDNVSGNDSAVLPETLNVFEFGLLDAHNEGTTTTSRVAVEAIPE